MKTYTDMACKQLTEYISVVQISLIRSLESLSSDREMRSLSGFLWIISLDLLLMHSLVFFSVQFSISVCTKIVIFSNHSFYSSRKNYSQAL